jgi:hypothetical protein
MTAIIPDLATFDAHDAQLRAFADAIDSDQSERWTDCFSDDIDFADYAMRTFGRGRAALSVFGEAWFTSFNGHHFELGDRSEAAAQTTLRWKLSATVASNASALTRTAVLGSRFTIHGVSLLRFGTDGKICWDRVYWDLTEMLRQIGVTEVPK